MSLGHADFSDFEDRDERPDDEQRKEPCDDQEAAKSSERELDGGFPEWVWLRLRRHRKELGLSLAEPDAKLVWTGRRCGNGRRVRHGAAIRRLSPSLAIIRVAAMLDVCAGGRGLASRRSSVRCVRRCCRCCVMFQA